MLVSRTAGLALRSRATRRAVCAGCCFAAQSAAFATAPPPPPAQPPTEPPTQDKRRRGRPKPPQLGPPDPPWPPSPNHPPPARRRAYTTPQGLAADVILAAATDTPYKFFPRDGDGGAKADVQLAVPLPPDLRTDYTDMGPDVFAPWRKRGLFRAVPEHEIRALGFNHGVRLRFSYSHALHPWFKKFLASSPGVEDEDGGNGLSALEGSGSGAGSGSGGPPQGFPHCSAEVLRRRYAHKNRTDPLWWFVLVGSDDALPTSQCVRSKMRLKVERALRAALRQRGYGAGGLRLDGGDGGDGEPGRPRARHHQMYGTLRVEGVLRPLLKVPYADLAAYLTKALGVVEGILGGRERGSLYDQGDAEGVPAQAAKTAKPAKTAKTERIAKKPKNTGNGRGNGAKKGKPRQEEESGDEDEFALLGRASSRHAHGIDIL